MVSGLFLEASEIPIYSKHFPYAGRESALGRDKRVTHGRKTTVEARWDLPQM